MEITQSLRGRIYTQIDILMTTNIPNVNSSNINDMIEMLYDYLDLSIFYFNYFLKNIHLLDVLEKNPDLHFIDEGCAVLASLYEVVHTLRRIFGFDDRVNFFFKIYDDMIRKLKPKQINPDCKICIEKAYKKDMVFDKIHTTILTNFIDYFNEKKGFNLRIISS